MGSEALPAPQPNPESAAPKRPQNRALPAPSWELAGSERFRPSEKLAGSLFEMSPALQQTVRDICASYDDSHDPKAVARALIGDELMAALRTLALEMAVETPDAVVRVVTPEARFDDAVAGRVAEVLPSDLPPSLAKTVLVELGQQFQDWSKAKRQAFGVRSTDLPLALAADGIYLNCPRPSPLLPR